jgi:homoserine O-acetyltransferase
MTDPVFESSDSLRGSGALRYAQQVTLVEPLRLELGGELPAVTVTYETYGRLNRRRDNAVLVCHAISGDSHVARHDLADDPGWWDLFVGPGRSIDTERYFVICSNILGGCRGTTGPNSIDAHTGQPYGADFPAITVGDMVEVQRRLVDQLGIDALRAVIGGSLGGHQALTWALRYPRRVRACVALATSPRLTSQALAFDVVGRNAILHDPGYCGGQYYEADGTAAGGTAAGGTAAGAVGPGSPQRPNPVLSPVEGGAGAIEKTPPAGPVVGLALARMLAHITYLSREAMTAKFDPSRLEPRDIATAFEKKFSVGSYLAYQGHRFVERFDANSYVTLSMAMDLFDLGDTPEQLRLAFASSHPPELAISRGRRPGAGPVVLGSPQRPNGERATEETPAAGPAGRRWLVVSFSSDWLFPPEQSRQIVDALLATDHRVSYCNVEASGGHDAFLLEEKLSIYGGLTRAFLAHGENEPLPTTPPGAPPQAVEEPTSIFHGQRLDYDLILELIPPAASVLDLGCGSGELLSRLRERGHHRLVGVELDERAVLACVERGLDVIQHDLEQGLSPFGNRQFDVVVLSQTLQSIVDTAGIIDEMLRVGGCGIVSFPNFAYHKLRKMLGEDGRSPKAGGIYQFEWYNTPNRRFPSIADVEEFCAAKRLRLHRQVYLDTETDRRITADPNLNADVAIFVLSRTQQC